MNGQHFIKEFLAAAQNDNNIRPIHISLYMALCIGGTPDGNSDVKTIYRRDIMPLARINSIATYHKYLKELVAFGYVNYAPSNNHYAGSKIRFTNPKTQQKTD